MGRWRTRVLLGAYWRRIRCSPAAVGVCCGEDLFPRQVGGLLPSLMTVGVATRVRGGLVAGYNPEGRPSFVNVAVHHHFGAVARAWISEPLEQVLSGRLPMALFVPEVEDLLHAACAGDFTDPIPVSLGGHMMDFARWLGWQPGMLVEDAADIFGFWTARGRLLGQSRVSRVVSGYYLSLLQARFRCRVGLHVRCSPSVRRGDLAFVRLSLLRWRWASF
jgi:hypothetical protein